MLLLTLNILSGYCDTRGENVKSDDRQSNWFKSFGNFFSGGEDEANVSKNGDNNWRRGRNCHSTMQVFKFLKKDNLKLVRTLT